jgi:hypothetical protein
MTTPSITDSDYLREIARPAHAYAGADAARIREIAERLDTLQAEVLKAWQPTAALAAPAEQEGGEQSQMDSGRIPLSEGRGPGLNAPTGQIQNDVHYLTRLSEFVQSELFPTRQAMLDLGWDVPKLCGNLRGIASRLTQVESIRSAAETLRSRLTYVAMSYGTEYTTTKCAVADYDRDVAAALTTGGNG